MTLKTRNGDEIKVSLKVAALLMGAIVAFCGWAVYMVRSSARLEANVQNMADNQRAYEARQDAQQREYQTQIVTAMATTDAYIAHQTNRLQKLETMLSREAQRELAEWDASHPAPPRVKPDSFRFKPKPQSNDQQNDERLLSNVSSGLQNNSMRGRRKGRHTVLFNPRSLRRAGKRQDARLNSVGARSC